MGPCFDRVASHSSHSSHSPKSSHSPTPTRSAPASPIKTRLISQSPRLHYWSGIARRGLEESGFLPLELNGGLAEINNTNADKGVVRDVFGEMTECIDDTHGTPKTSEALGVREQVRSTALKYFEDVVDPLLLSQDTTYASSPAPATPARGRFEVWTSLRVERVVFDEVEAEKAVGVQTRFGVVRARREVILCAGAIQSPYILLQSGIGPASHLAARGVPLVYDSPGVGRNLWEHPFVDVRAKLRPTHRKDTVETFASLMTSAPHLHQWSTERTGLMSGLPYEWLAYSNMHSELSPLFTSPSPSPSPSQPSASSPPLVPTTPTDTHVLLRSNAPHVEHFIHYGHGLAPAPDAMASSYIAVSTVLLVPRSRGYVEIPASRGAESVADENPRIVVNQLKDPVDLHVLRTAVRRAFAILGAPAWREYLEYVGEKGDAELDDIVRQRATTLWHYGGTCAMKTTSTLGDGVVDTSFRVEGVEGLRVADTSVIPFPVVGHTQAVAYAIGEKMAELLAQEYLF
ncbi:FAD/NAD(P)-binding domain-containing protein [Pleurotus eryngii]|uniref:FAD/NAD(P)-binding domain-containing protein n=1 Tax=Pleurotus eryngii TaxID=5323 RepID=A0A9P6DFZ6_PLEER|nr:FAD/NAD(P)-binding domain-containing protein [Pleurotus eryngii]